MQCLKIGRMMANGIVKGRLIPHGGGNAAAVNFQRNFGGQPGFGLGGTRKMASYGGGRGVVTFPEPHMSELPIPEGPWDKYNKKMNSKNNRHLIVGLGFYLFTLTVIFNSGLVTLNSTIPELPGGKFGGGCIPTPVTPPAPKC